MENTDLCSILIPSCDQYSDLWRPFLTLFWRYWPDCPYRVLLGSNQQCYDDARVNVIHSAHGSNWTNRVRDQLHAVRTPYVLLMLEDFFLRRSVSTKQVQRCLLALKRSKGHMVRLTLRPGPDLHLSETPELGIVSVGAPYRVSTQAAIWRVESLLSLMRDRESIWEFEINGSVRSADMPAGFYCTRRNVIDYGRHVVERGKWFPWEAWRFSRAHIGCDFNRRPTMTFWEAMCWSYWKGRSLILNLIPWRQRLALMSTVRRLDVFGLGGRSNGLPRS